LDDDLVPPLNAARVVDRVIGWVHPVITVSGSAEQVVSKDFEKG
jgi:hypothetical protein